MRKFYAMIGMAMICLVLFACQRPQLVPSVARISTSTSLSCSPPRGAVWYSWLAAQNPLDVYTLLADRDTVWAGTSLGVRRINTKTGSYVAYEELGDTRLLLLVEDGHVWAASDRGLFYFDGNRWVKPEMSLGSVGVTQLGVDQAGDLYACFHTRYQESYRYAGHVPPAHGPWKVESGGGYFNPTVCEQWQTATTGSYTHRSSAECDALNRARWNVYREMTKEYPLLAIDADQSVWWATKNILGHLSDSRSISLTLPVGRIYALAPDPKHGVWLGTDRGLAYSDESTLRWMTLGLDQCTLRGIPKDIVVDSRKVAWLLTTNGDVQRFAPGDLNWKPVTELGAVAKGRPVQTIAAAPGGGIWITHGYDLQRFDGAAVIQSVTAPTPESSLYSLLVEPSGTIWSFSYHSLLQFIPSKSQWVRRDLVKPGVLIPFIVARDGTLYALDNRGVIAYTGTQPLNGAIASLQWHLVVPMQISTSDRPVLAGDNQGGVWIGLCDQHELWHYQGGKLMLYRKRDELVSLGATISTVFCPKQLYVDARSRLWAGMMGLLVVNDGQGWQNIPVSVGMISKLTGGPDGRIWVIGDKGVGVYDPAADKQP